MRAAEKFEKIFENVYKEEKKQPLTDMQRSLLKTVDAFSPKNVDNLNIV